LQIDSDQSQIGIEGFRLDSVRVLIFNIKKYLKTLVYLYTTAIDALSIAKPKSATNAIKLKNNK